jgi:hypothetical protein
MAERHRHRILQLSAAHLDEVLEFLCLLFAQMASTSRITPA